MSKISFGLINRLTRKKKLKIILTVVLLILVLIGGWTASVYRQKFQASSIFDSTFESTCRANLKTPVDTIKIPALLKDTYGKDYPGLQTVSNYSVDLDTYAASWKSILDGDTLLQDYKAKLPSIISAIRAIYGEPFQNHQVVVVVVPDLENSQYNEWQTSNMSGLYRPDLNLILYSEQAANSPATFIHEIIHSFNQGTIVSDAYEEGLVESAAIRVTQQLGLPLSTQHAFDTDNRPDLSVVMGYFRTSDNYSTTNDRYDAAAKTFSAFYDKDQNFYKTFRANLKKSTYFNEIIADSKKFVADRLIGASICGDLMFKPDYNVLRPYVSDLQYVLYKSLSTTQRKTLLASDPILRNLTNIVLTDNQKLHLFQNVTAAQSINIYPESKLYNSIAFYPSTDRVSVYSSYKRNDLLEIFYEYYKQSNAQDEDHTNYINLDKVKQFSASVATDDNSILSKLTKLLETAPDRTYVYLTPQTAATERTPAIGVPANGYRSIYPICVTSSDPKSKVCSNTIRPNSSSDNEIVSYNSASLLSETKLPSNFTGNINVNISSIKVRWVVTPKRGSAGGVWPLTQVVWPDGFAAEPKAIMEKTMSVVSFVNGKISGVSSGKEDATGLEKLKESVTAVPPSSPSVTTAAATAVAGTGATLAGNIIRPTSGSELPITKVGFKYGTSSTNLNNSITGNYPGSFTTKFSANITSGLKPGETYYFKAYAVNSVGTGWGSVASFTVPKATPSTSAATSTSATSSSSSTSSTATNATSSASTIASSTVSVANAVMNNATSATFTAKVVSTGNAKITKRGFLYGLVGNNDKPADAYSTGSFSAGQFSKTVTLKANTRYWVQAYMENSAGKRTVGDTLANFKMVCTAPTVSTNTVTDITEKSATPHGTIKSIGSMPITKRGFQWGYSTSTSKISNSYPLIYDSVTKVPFTVGSFSRTPAVTGLSGSKTYQVRAYVYSKCGTSYGNWVQFKTRTSTNSWSRLKTRVSSWFRIRY